MFVRDSPDRAVENPDRGGRRGQRPLRGIRGRIENASAGCQRYQAPDSSPSPGLRCGQRWTPKDRARLRQKYSRLLKNRQLGSSGSIRRSKVKGRRVKSRPPQDPASLSLSISSKSVANIKRQLAVHSEHFDRAVDGIDVHDSHRPGRLFHRAQ
jgi:hypothetical protein